MLKSPGSVPERVTLLIVIALPLLFVRVTVFCAPIPPTVTDAQLKLVGETVAPEAAPAKARQHTRRPALKSDRGKLRLDLAVDVCF